MNNEQQSQVISRAKAQWDAGQPYNAGIIIFERIPLIYRSLWAADLLDVVSHGSSPTPEITAVLEFARQPEQWPQSRANEAHDIFDAVRAINLLNTPSILSKLLDCAEDTAGITYTARQYPAPFDHHRGWRIVERYYDLIKELSLDESDAWQIVANKHYIRLDNPIHCHPACPMCRVPRWDYA